MSEKLSYFSQSVGGVSGTGVTDIKPYHKKITNLLTVCELKGQVFLYYIKSICAVFLVRTTNKKS